MGRRRNREHLDGDYGRRWEILTFVTGRLSRGGEAFICESGPPDQALRGVNGHYWAHELRALGHDVRLMAPSYVKP